MEQNHRNSNSNHTNRPQNRSAQNNRAVQQHGTAVAARRRKKKNSAAIITVCVIALFAVLAAAVMTLLFYKPQFSPGDHPLQSGDISNVIFTDDKGNVTDSLERDQDSVNFLIMGRDRWAFNTDVMILLSYNVKEGAISMMQIPRDTYFDMGQGNHKANSILAMYYNQERRKNDSEDAAYAAAMSDVKKALEDVFCVKIDYYAIIDLNGFVNIIDAIGGVEMDVPARMKYSDPVQKLYIDLQPGLQTLTGAQAEQFIRFRSGYVEGDIGRVDAQKLFISACIAQIKKNFNPSTISAILEQVFKYVTTDIPFKDLVYYAKSALSVDLSKMTMLTLPGIQCRQYENTGIWYYAVYRDATIAVLNKYFNHYNYDVTSEIFDRDDAFYDESGTYMHSLYLTRDAEEESYTVDQTDDIYIYRYSSTSSKPSTTAPQTTDAPSVTDNGGIADDTGEAVHTEDAPSIDEPLASEPEESASAETLPVLDELEETTVIINMPEEPDAPEENN